ncbi:MAG: hypothetical protein R3339_11800, partial [Thermodesulfobacteriota bacterium]|nr:hypothetical protein [Thermodesulfobacteriota bacterium]
MNRRTTITMILLACILLLSAFVIELMWGLSVTSGFHNIPVGEMYIIGGPEQDLHLSIDSPPGKLPFSKVRVPIEVVSLTVDPSLSENMVMSSNDRFIWGDRWPWLKQLTLTVKNEKQREGFETLFKPEKLMQLRKDYKKEIILGISSYGLLISE